MKLLAVLAVAACTKPVPGVCCENEVECTRLGLAADDTRPCADGVCVANGCVASGCDDDGDCGDPMPFCVVGTCSAGCDGDEDCLDPDFPLCQGNICSVDCVARGGRIVFQSDRGGDDDLFSMFADGFGQVPMFATNNNERGPRWSPDASRVAFLSDDDQDFDIYLLDPMNPTPTKITDNLQDDQEIEWAPDGARIAYTTSTAPLTAQTVAVDGTGVTDLIGVLGGDSASPSWAPDSTNLVFLSSGTGMNPPPLHVFVTLPPDGRLQLTTTLSTNAVGRWSPDGTRISFTDDTTLKLAAPDNSVSEELGSGFEISEIEWSPDGSQFAVVMTTGGNKDIWVVDRASGAITQLTTSGAEDARPRWSPDGQRLVFESARDGNFELYVMNADGSNPTNLTSSPGDDRSPDWAVCP